ncbi:unnamed protein product [Porites evermanni]|uniref:Sodefrin-like factor n=1 Tax=Porites evermanni TaxID=104178 RepID=A0ABN8PFI0_9CNID|nr:unnamed protein product [Porites evermanni]
MAEIQARSQPPIFFCQVEDCDHRCQSDLVTAITCYECVPEPPDNWCQFTSNVTDCDEKSKTDGAEYDACAKTSLEVLYEGDNHLMNIMSCTTKSKCDTVKERICRKDVWYEHFGIEVQKCNVDCCSNDECNGFPTATAMVISGSFKATPTSLVFLCVGAALTRLVLS